MLSHIPSLCRKVLLCVHSTVLPNMPNPLLLSDFLTASLSRGGIIGMLALHGIFTLVTKARLRNAEGQAVCMLCDRRAMAVPVSRGLCAGKLCTSKICLAMRNKKSIRLPGALTISCRALLPTPQHGLEYPQFFQRLYSLLKPAVFLIKNRAQFFQLADVFLSSPMVPAYTAAAFAKRFGRLALTAPPHG